MLRLFANRNLLRRHGLPAQIRLNATAPPRPPRADLASIPQTIRELLPQPRKHDPDASPPRRRRGPLFYLMISALGRIGLCRMSLNLPAVSPLFIWIEAEKYFDPKPLLEKKRKRIVRERLQNLQGARVGGFSDAKSVVAYLRYLFGAMLPPDILRHMRSEEVCALLEQECPENLFKWLQEVCAVTYQLSQVSQDVEKEVTTAEQIEESADGILRKCYQSVYQRLPPLPDAPSGAPVSLA
ncbi:hypothetical protein GGX14DRAFT_474860 [Mycena pura]|uniref:Uncharacterized protein n=1 Tax=Mycena pura TaxID=153505 RepID=A0AAD6UYT1_9AGAR|nr:hypothetical protein GGX14DRAFT_474860 [Mycena pura]